MVDFKTDALAGRAPAELAGRYAAQREVYALAAAGGDGAAVRAVHLFLEQADEPVSEEFDPAGLDAARERLEAMIAEIRGGAFAPTAEPTLGGLLRLPGGGAPLPAPRVASRAAPGLPPPEPEADDAAPDEAEAAAGAPATQGTLFEA